MSQESMILNHLQQHGSITPLQALTDLGCYRLSARILELSENFRTQGERA